MSQKNLDRNGRWRNIDVSFRVSEEESRAINEAVALSGLTKRAYITTKLLNRDVVVVGNPRVFKMLKTKMDDIYEQLVRISTTGEVTEELTETINLVAKIYWGMVDKQDVKDQGFITSQGKIVDKTE